MRTLLYVFNCTFMYVLIYIIHIEVGEKSWCCDVIRGVITNVVQCQQPDVKHCGLNLESQIYITYVRRDQLQFISIPGL